MLAIWAKQLLAPALKKCPKCNKLPNVVTLFTTMKVDLWKLIINVDNAENIFQTTIPTLAAFIGVTNVCGPSPQQRACCGQSYKGSSVINYVSRFEPE